MHLMKVDPRALRDNPDNTRQTKSTPQADALLLATIRAVGIIQPPVIFPAKDGGNDYVIEAGHRRTRLAIAAGLEEIDVVVVEAANDNGAMRSMVENIAREPLNPVDQWTGIERLVALNWTEEAIAVALALPVRRIKQLRLLANVLPAMLDQMAKGDMPEERQLRTIAAAPIDEQKEIWKKYKPSKADPEIDWWRVAQGLTKTRMFAKDASFGDELAQAYGIQWVEDLFAPADQDGRYTTDVEAFLGAQQEWMAQNLPKRGVIVEASEWGGGKLPAKAERVHGKPQKSDSTAMYLDRDGKVQTVHFRMPEGKKAKGKSATGETGAAGADGQDVVLSKPRPDVTQSGHDMIGDYRTDALHAALGRAPIEDDTLMALLILAFAGLNIRVSLGSGDDMSSTRRIARHAARLFDVDGKLSFEMDTLRIAARSMLTEVLSCRRDASNSGIVSRVAGDTIGADSFLPNMGTDDFLSCLSRQALEASCKDTSVLPRPKVRETRAALATHFKDGRFVHPSALFAPDMVELTDWIRRNAVVEDNDRDDAAAEPSEETASGEPSETPDDNSADEEAEGFREAAE
ncbi:ParB N-terminal domain-containing protein (plasmid) [Rhizobium sp. CB3060]|uniref:ParB N-terminal domain-containing protein n=1 Tax=Rhizobium sp. CB3060 TaxID=3138255 RepID=UPI0021A658E0|nr:ParB N-terminal domain-containing protein [Rhizobium tropici]UWU25999.1 ParB N-terminal domain-containing protein [Rhizobium tropici]